MLNKDCRGKRIFAILLPCILLFSEKVYMTKKLVVCITYTLCIIIILIHSYIAFSGFLFAKIEQDKVTLTLEKPAVLSTDEFIEELVEISDLTSSDIMLCRVSQGTCFQYYKTNEDKNFLDLSTSQGSTLIPDGVMLSTHDDANPKIYAFIPDDMSLEIYTITSLYKTDIDLSYGKFLINEEYRSNWLSELSNRGIPCEISENNLIAPDSSLLLVLAVFTLMLFISVIIYTFSRGRDFIVKKSLGYSDANISLDEVKHNIFWSIPLTLSVILTAFFILGIKYNFESSLLFLYNMFPMMLLLIFFLHLTMLISTYLVSKSCRVQCIKGQNNNKTVFAFACVSKAIFFVILAAYISQMAIVVGGAVNEYTTLKASADKLSGFAMIPSYMTVEDPEDDPEKYVPRMMNFYEDIHDQKQVIIADMSQAVEENTLPDGSTIPAYVRVNDNYLDFAQTITDMAGNRITSTSLNPEKYNVLIPSGWSKDLVLSIRANQERYGDDAFNFIEYDPQSTFFSFTTRSSTDEPGFVKNVIAYVYDPKITVKYEPPYIIVGNFLSFFSGKMFFSYDSGTELTPYEQIHPILQKNGLAEIAVQSPSVLSFYESQLSQTIGRVTFLGAILCALTFALIYLIVFSAEQYFLNYARSISIKIMTGHTLLDICMGRIILKAAIIPVTSILGLFMSISLPLVITAVLLEICIFILILRKQSERNIVSIIKGRN